MNKTLHLLRRAHGLMHIVLIAVLLLVVPSTAMAEKQAYARLADNILTFYYDENKGQTDADFSLNSGTDEPEWLAKWPYIFKVVFDESFQDYKPTTCYKWFYKIQDLKSIDGLEYLNTSEVTNMSHMFYGCWYVELLDVTHFDTKNVTDMSYMFCSLNSVDELDVTGFNTDNVTDMSYMFYNSSLTQLNLANFKTDKVTNMSGMFYACNLLTELDLSNFTTSAVTDMSSMFSNCKALTKLNLSSFDTGNVTDMYEMFYSCKLLTELNISGFNTAKVTDMSEMFSGCTSLANLDVSNFNTANVEDMCYMFLDCHALTSIDLSGFNTAKVKDMECMLNGCSTLTTLDLSSFNTAAVTSMEEMFNGCTALTTIMVSKNFTTTAVEKSDNMFSGCTSLKGAVAYDASKVDAAYANWETGYFTLKPEPYVRYADQTLTFYYGTDKQDGDYSLELEDSYPEWYWDRDILGAITKVVFDKSFSDARPTTTENWFDSMSSLKSIEGIEYLNTSESTSMFGMFRYCSSLTSLDLSHFNTAKVIDMYSMFYGCSNLTSLNLSNFDSGNVEEMSCMFEGCSSLKTINLSGLKTDNAFELASMFYGCSSLTTLDLSSFNISDGKVLPKMFGECTSLKTIYVSDGFNGLDGNPLIVSRDMFDGCVSLKGAVAYDASNIDGAYANYTTGYFTKKVGTNGSDILGATGSPLTIENLAIDDAKAYALNEDEDCQAATATYSRPMTSYWGTLCLPFAIDAAAQGNTCNFYSLKSVNAESITLTQIQNGTIEAGTPVVISKKTDGQTAICVTATNAPVVAYPITTTSNNSLAGTFAEVLLGDDAYFIAKDKFFNVADYRLVKVNPFRAYIQASGNANRAAVLNIVADGSTTGIDATDTIDALNNANTEYYDMNGCRTSGLQKGVNIIKTGNKTRKVIVK